MPQLDLTLYCSIINSLYFLLSFFYIILLVNFFYLFISNIKSYYTFFSKIKQANDILIQIF